MLSRIPYGKVKRAPSVWTPLATSGIVMQTIRMNSTHPVAPDGFHAETWESGSTHHTSELVARVVVGNGWAEYVNEETEVEVQPVKGPAPENKALGAAPENKSQDDVEPQPRRRGRPRKVVNGNAEQQP